MVNGNCRIHQMLKTKKYHFRFLFIDDCINSHNYFHLLLICNLVYSREISIKMMANKQLRKTIFCLAMPSAARLLLYSYVQRNVNVQDNTTQYLERVWFDYCSVHVSTVSSHSALWFSSLSQ
ncbi:hypothetical protein T06_9755 [Trichinella sp. T6]|nr:hypothetical protein T06_9755 [Trichinella sp. T6]